jgi:type IV pilus assembly protein PilA
MKTELKVKFLNHLSQKRKDEGFTLIELLVVIIIIGILSAIALPSFLNQASKAKQAEAKQYVGSTNRAQQAYRIENASFASSASVLGLGLPDTTVNYAYAITGSSDTASVTATGQDVKSLKSFSGGVAILTVGSTAAVACQTTGVSTSPPAITFATGVAPTCPANTSELMK